MVFYYQLLCAWSRSVSFSRDLLFVAVSIYLLYCLLQICFLSSLTCSSNLVPSDSSHASLFESEIPFRTHRASFIVSNSLSPIPNFQKRLYYHAQFFSEWLVHKLLAEKLKHDPHIFSQDEQGLAEVFSNTVLHPDNHLCTLEVSERYE